MHRFAEGRRLILGGVDVQHPRGLQGHSDADVLVHAVADAILGACALGDLGEHFPSEDERWRDVSSLKLLEHVVSLAKNAGFSLVNVDTVLVAQEPRLKDYQLAMRTSLATSLGVGIGDISVKLKTAEGLGALGRAEGIQAHAVVSVEAQANG